MSASAATAPQPAPAVRPTATTSPMPGSVPIHAASMNGHAPVVRLLLDHGADVNHADPATNTPLLLATRNGHEGVVKVLLERGANINLALMDGTSPLRLATIQGHAAVARHLIAHGADPHEMGSEGKSLLYVASEKGHVDMVQLLLSNVSARVDVAPLDGVSPLLIASKKDHKQVVRALLGHFDWSSVDKIRAHSSVKDVVSGACLGCGARRQDQEKARRCSKCHVAVFCSRECLQSAWPAHKGACKIWSKQQEAVPGAAQGATNG
mmetsp:Transcript_21563/g.57986  ORF Transcript_21563/g.57986 Transcript_21563/m.57986 type:complete len:266 (+) Transcript_21563:72-869(+)